VKKRDVKAKDKLQVRSRAASDIGASDATSNVSASGANKKMRGRKRLPDNKYFGDAMRRLRASSKS